ncbi:MAG: hypothetical protein ACOX4H_12150 [Bacillota bacterium]|jgi:hypothetical protein|nr:hypothetical protein [Clostridia bacterium]
MSRRRHRRREKEEKRRHQKGGKGLSLSSLLTTVDFKVLSNQLRDIAGYMETFGQLTELFQLADVFINPKHGKSKGQSFNLMNVLKDKDSLDQLFQMLSPNMRDDVMDTRYEKKVEPINVETHHPEK